MGAWHGAVVLRPFLRKRKQQTVIEDSLFLCFHSLSFSLFLSLCVHTLTHAHTSHTHTHSTLGPRALSRVSAGIPRLRGGSSSSRRRQPSPPPSSSPPASPGSPSAAADCVRRERSSAEALTIAKEGKGEKKLKQRASEAKAERGSDAPLQAERKEETAGAPDAEGGQNGGQDTLAGQAARPRVKEEPPSLSRDAQLDTRPHTRPHTHAQPEPPAGPPPEADGDDVISVEFTRAFQPMYNACPMSYTPVLRLRRGRRVLQPMKWGTRHALVALWMLTPASIARCMRAVSSYGSISPAHDPVLLLVAPVLAGLVPSWHKGDARDFKLSTFNARLEGLDDKVSRVAVDRASPPTAPCQHASHRSRCRAQATFRNPLRRGRRCIVFADGFYEWATTKEGKQPYFLYMAKSGNAQRTAGARGRPEDREKGSALQPWVASTVAGLFFSNSERATAAGGQCGAGVQPACRSTHDCRHLRRARQERQRSVLCIVPLAFVAPPCVTCFSCLWRVPLRP